MKAIVYLLSLCYWKFLLKAFLCSVYQAKLLAEFFSFDPAPTPEATQKKVLMLSVGSLKWDCTCALNVNTMVSKKYFYSFPLSFYSIFWIMLHYNTDQTDAILRD